MKLANYCRILPEPLEKKDIEESLKLAIRLAAKKSRSEICLCARCPYKIVALFEGIISGRERKELLAGKCISYHGVNVTFTPSVANDKKYDVILAIDYLPEDEKFSNKNFDYLIVIACANSDNYNLACDYWILNEAPKKF